MATFKTPAEDNHEITDLIRVRELVKQKRKIRKK